MYTIEIQNEYYQESLIYTQYLLESVFNPELFTLKQPVFEAFYSVRSDISISERSLTRIAFWT